MTEKKRVKKAVIGSARSIYRAAPILIGVTLLVSLVSTLVPTSSLIGFFGKNNFLNILLSTLLGSLFAGNPINSYVIAGELLSFGLGIVAVTSFLIAWVTVGVVQLPAEIMMLGKNLH